MIGRPSLHWPCREWGARALAEERVEAARTIEAVSGLMNLVMMPMWVLSGVFFASTNFPEPMQPFIRALPLTALNNALRGVMNEGLSLAAVGGDVAILVAWGLITFVLALRIFRWQ